MTVIHEAASKGYAGAAQAYQSGRPGYPDDAKAWLRDVIGLRAGKSVVDLGAGTGKFLPLLRETGARLIAVEPVAEMRAEIERTQSDVQVMRGTATAIPLADGSIDAVVCAQAFHWFATPEALAEIRRILVPNGVLGLIWNVRDETVPWIAALNRIIDPLSGDAPRYSNGAWKKVFPAKDFTFLGERRARHVHAGPPDRVIIDRVMSISYVAALPEEGRSAVLTAIRTLIDGTPELVGAKKVAMAYDTVMYAYRRTA